MTGYPFIRTRIVSEEGEFTSEKFDRVDWNSNNDIMLHREISRDDWVTIKGLYRIDPFTGKLDINNYHIYTCDEVAIRNTLHILREDMVDRHGIVVKKVDKFVMVLYVPGTKKPSPISLDLEDISNFVEVIRTIPFAEISKTE